jgi:tungstate transport system substrate-binding protein
MRWHQFVLFLLLTALLGTGPAGAQERAVVVGAPPGALTELLHELAAIFQDETGIVVKSVATGTAGRAANLRPDALLLPSRGTKVPPGAEGSERRPVLLGEAVLVGSRADRARIHGLRDIKAALRWIASARGLYVSSSPALGLRELELALWDAIGVDVRTRSTWYVEATGDEADVLKQAASLGAYVLVERATWAAQRDRRGLEVLAAGDPALRTVYASQLVRRESQDARAWHDWLSSEPAQAAIAGWRPGGIQVFTPPGDEGSDGERRPPRT